MKVCRLITFDLMHTVMDITVPVGVGYSEVAARFGIHICPDRLTNNFGKMWKEMRVKHPNYGLSTRLGGWQKWWQILISETLKHSTSDVIDNKTLCAISEKLLNDYSNSNRWECCDGAVDFLKYCQSKGIALAILSNFDGRIEMLLESKNLRRYFRYVITSYSIGFEKPDQRIFSVTENIAKNFDDLRDIKKNEILHIGDMPEFDYIPAKRAGWDALLVSKTIDTDAILKKHPELSRQCIFRDFHEVINRFHQL